MKHTPAPLRADDSSLRLMNRDVIGGIMLRDTEGRDIVFVIGTDDEAHANTRLFRHAAELLDAAKEVVARWEAGDLAGAVTHMNGVIAESEGEV